MHPSCPDFDLCSDCEALPIPVHPLNHPMLKLKTFDTIIPTVYRAGQTRTADELSSQEPVPVGGEPSTSLTLSPVMAPIKSPELKPVVVSSQATSVAAEDQTPFAEEFLSPPGSPVPGEVPTIVTITPSQLADVAEPPKSPKSLHPPLDIYHQLWPRVNQEMMHLNAMQAPRAEVSIVNANEGTVAEIVAHEPLVAEARPQAITATSSIAQVADRPSTRSASPVSGVKSVVDDYRTPSPMLSDVQGIHHAAQQVFADDQAPRQSSLDSTFMGDANVPDGQIFPPGAEFVKGWHMMNSGGLPWPSTTEVRFVGGEMFASKYSVALRAKVGAVDPGQALDIWTGDLKVGAYQV